MQATKMKKSRTNVRDLVEMVGLEPMTSCMSSKRSNQLSYTSIGGTQLVYHTFSKKARGFFIFFAFPKKFSLRMPVSMPFYRSSRTGSSSPQASSASFAPTTQSAASALAASMRSAMARRSSAVVSVISRRRRTLSS